MHKACQAGANTSIYPQDPLFELTSGIYFLIHFSLLNSFWLWSQGVDWALLENLVLCDMDFGRVV